MPKAELTNVGSLIRVETCGHFMCSCKTTLDDAPTTALVNVKGAVINDEILTLLDFRDDFDNQKLITVRGIYRPDQVVDAFNKGDGKMVITDAGLACCALDRLGR